MAKLRHVPPQLGRRRAFTSPSFKILIICEGDNTEPDYFEKFAETFGNKLVTLDFETGAGVPATIVKKAIDAKRKAANAKVRRSGFEVHDEIWAVFDFDEHPNVKHVIGQAKASGIRVAYSNPCFELWGVLHLEGSDGPVSGRDVQRKLQQLMPKYDKNGAKIFDYSMLVNRYDAARQRAMAGKKSRMALGDRYDNPVTNVYKLTDSIINNSRQAKREQLAKGRSD